jgi:hypothetical protein
MNAGWIIPFIILGGALQSCGAAMNGQLNKHVVNPWLASAAKSNQPRGQVYSYHADPGLLGGRPCTFHKLISVAT